MRITRLENIYNVEENEKVRSMLQDYLDSQAMALDIFCTRHRLDYYYVSKFLDENMEVSNRFCSNVIEALEKNNLDVKGVYQ